MGSGFHKWMVLLETAVLLGHLPFTQATWLKISDINVKRFSLSIVENLTCNVQCCTSIKRKEILRAVAIISEILQELHFHQGFSGSV